MPKLFKSASDRQFASVVSKMVYCNPFTVERLRLEMTALGVAFDETARGWNLDPRDKVRHSNMAQLSGRIKTILDDLVGHYRDGRGSEEERALYADLVTLLLYIGSRNDLDDMIAAAHAKGFGPRKVAFYKDFLDGFRHYFGHDQLPVQPDHLFACYFQIRRAFFHIFHFFVGTSPAAMGLRAQIWQSIFTHDLFRYQRSLYQRMPTIPTLITGPSGTGKEVVARAIGFSQYVAFDTKSLAFKSDFTKSFYPVNLSALSPTLIESELFGHRKGAFTGALADREGYFAACGEGGTVFLDEIGEADQSIQVKLLRVLQTRQFQRLGDVQSEPFLGKVITATNRNLMEEMAAGRFREDFYFRLRSDVIKTISFKEMVNGDEAELRFLAEYASGRVAGEIEAPGLIADFMEWAKAYRGYSWPGNFRELEQALRSILVHGGYEPPQPVKSGPRDLPAELAATGWSLRQLTEVYVLALYQQTPVYEEIARQLGVDRRTVKRYLPEK